MPLNRKAARKRKRKNSVWTEMRLAFVLNWKGNAMEAAREAGFSDPKCDAAKLMAIPEIEAAIEKKRERLFDLSARQMVKEITINPAAIINGLAQEAALSENPTSRVKAWDSLAEIFGMKTHFSADLTDKLSQGKTKEELIYAGIHGRWAETPEVAAAYVRGIAPSAAGQGGSDGNDTKRPN